MDENISFVCKPKYFSFIDLYNFKIVTSVLKVPRIIIYDEVVLFSDYSCGVF